MSSPYSRGVSRAGNGLEYPYLPFTAALLFAVHPIHTDAVVNGITEVSFSFFFLLSFYYHIKGEVPAVRYAAPLFFLAALLKETALTLPILLIAYDYSLGRVGKIQLLVRRYLPYIVAASVYFLLRFYALGGLAPAKRHAGLSAYEQIINVFPLFADYLEKLLLPLGQYCFRVEGNKRSGVGP